MYLYFYEFSNVKKKFDTFQKINFIKVQKYPLIFVYISNKIDFYKK